MAVAVRLSELTQITSAQITDSDLLLITDSESTSSKKLTLSDFKSHLFSGNSFGSFNDVDLSGGATDGQFLRYNAATQRWNAGDISLSSIGSLSDVDLVSVAPTEGQTLIWDGTLNKFQPGTIDLTPITDALGISAGDDDLGAFVGAIDISDMSVKQALQTLSNAIVSRQQEVQNDVDANEASAVAGFASATTARDALDTRLTTAETTISNLDIDIAPETLNSINELAAALGDDPAFLSTVQTDITNLSTTVTNTQATQDGRLTQLESDFSSLGAGLAPDSLDTINELANTLQKLVPPAPTSMDGLAVSVSTNASTARLCTGFTDRTGGTSGYSAGDSIKRNTDGSVTTTKIHDIGPGDSGTVRQLLFGSTVSVSLNSGTNSYDFNGLNISDNKDASESTRDSGIAAGFYQVYDLQSINASVINDGLNYIYYDQGTNETQKDYFYEDESTPGAPTITTSSVYVPDDTTHVVQYSSGIPHYTENAANAWEYSLFVNNGSGDMYTRNDFVRTAQTSGFQDPGDLTYTDFGGTNPPAKDFATGAFATATASQAPRNLHISVSNTNSKFSNWTITTPYGTDSARASTTATIHIMGTTARTNVMDEDNILVSNVGSGAGNAVRVGDSDGDNPIPLHTTWDPTVTPADHEAIVVGGKLKWDNTDYSTTLHYPDGGPALNARPGTPQYFEVELTRQNVSQFTINYTGSCAGCFVCMPDNTAWVNSLTGTNGWADMFQAYRGSGVPTTAEPGCSSGGVMDNNGGSFTCVFGTESSSNDANDRILVRWKLTSGQQINTMSFS